MRGNPEAGRIGDDRRAGRRPPLRLRALAALRAAAAAAGMLACAGCGGRAAVTPASEPASGRGPAPSETARSGTPGPGHPADDFVAEEIIADDGFAAVADPPGTGVAASAPPPAAGARIHTVRRGDTLYSLARRYGVSVRSLQRVNGISDPRRVPVGMRLVIPGSGAEPPRAVRTPGGADRKEARADRKGARGPAARPMDRARPAETPVQAASVLPLPPGPRAERIDPGRGAIPAPALPGTDGLALAWPLGGRLTGSFGMRGRSKHEGIDIDGRKGQTVRAAAAGIVERTGEDGKYGKMVVIDHGGGITTLYAHASRILVKPGDRVDRNEPIAEVGRTGNASGHHLHFEMRRDGRPIDPLPALRHGVLRTPAREASAR